MAISGVDSTGYSSAASSSSSLDESNTASSLSLDDFMTLLTTQLKNQDPLNPTDSAQMLSQMAQISTVSGISQLNDTVDGLKTNLQSTQALQGSSLVGNSVLVSSSVGYLSGGQMSGKVQIGDGTQSVSDLSIGVYDKSGTLVKTLNEGDATGYDTFTWDGTDNDGNSVADAVYSIEASGTLDGTKTALPTAIYGDVSSVLTSSSGLQVNLKGLGSVALSDVQEVK